MPPVCDLRIASAPTNSFCLVRRFGLTKMLAYTIDRWALDPMSIKRIAILGSTGSIGCQTLDVIKDSADLEVCALAAKGNWELLVEQARQFAPQAVALSDIDEAHNLRKGLDEEIGVDRKSVV